MNSLPNSSDDIKKWLDDAVKKIQASNQSTDPEKPEPSGGAEKQTPEPEQPVTDIPAARQMTGSTDPDTFTAFQHSDIDKTVNSAPEATSEPAAADSGVPAAPKKRKVFDFDAPDEAEWLAAFDFDAPASPEKPAAPVAGAEPPSAISSWLSGRIRSKRAEAPAQSDRTPPQRAKASEQSSRTPPQRAEAPAQSDRTPPQRAKAPETSSRTPPKKEKAPGFGVIAAFRRIFPAKQESADETDAAAEKENVRTKDKPADDKKVERTADAPPLDIGPADFKLKFDFDSAYIDVPEEKPLRLRRERRTGCVGGILYSAFVICISLVLASLAWLAAADVLGFGTPDEQVTMLVPRDFDIEDIIDKLYDAKLIKYKFLFKIYANYSHAEDKISAGSYILNKNYDYRALVYGMTTWEGVLVETTVTIPEGFTLAEIFTRLDDFGICDAADLWDTATNYNFNYSFLNRSTRGQRHRLEGFLFPETYNFYLDSSPVLVLDKFLSEFNRRFTETYIERAEDMGYSVRDIISIASIIEREAGSDEERPRIAAVIYNRLNNRESYPYLQIDATIYYAIAGTGRTFSTDIDSPYNTYLFEGLPPSPISNPGIESIRAALYPDSTDEYYYALNLKGTHEFFRTLSQHEAFVSSDEYGGR